MKYTHKFVIINIILLTPFHCNRMEFSNNKKGGGSHIWSIPVG